MSKVTRYIIDIVRKNVFLREIALKARNELLRASYMKYFKCCPVDDKLCVFEAFNGRSYSDSPKAVYLELLNDDKYKEYRFVWAFIHPERYRFLERNRNTTVVKYHSDEYKRTYASAKYWFTPSRLPDYIVPKEGQKYIQFWHGTPLKRLGFDIKVEGKNAVHTVKEWAQQYESDALRYAFMVSPSRFVTEKYISAFNLKRIGKENCIIETGYPRNDALYSFDEKFAADVRKKLSIPAEKKIILYAPTWRDDQYKPGTGYSYDPKIDFEKFREHFGYEYVVLFRTHYLVADMLDFSEYRGFVYNVSSYEDVNDLYIISDMIITDYSSVFFDYANLKRPILFYMYDLEDYKNNARDFYLDLDDLPGPIVKTEDDLYDAIKSIDKYWEKYGGKYEAFNKKFNYLDDANSSQRVLDIIVN